MTATTEVAKTEAAVPALANTPALELTADDVALPRVYLGQFMSAHVQEKRVPSGSIFTALGQDDPEPEVLWEQGQDEGVKLHVLSLTKGKSISEGGELVLFDFHDPNAPEDAWVTYNYVVAIPAVDPDLPFKWLCTRTARPCAQQINLILAKNQAKGPAHELAFELTAAERSNAKGKYFVPRARHIEADDESVKLAATQAASLGAAAQAPATSTNEPAI